MTTPCLVAGSSRTHDLLIVRPSLFPTKFMTVFYLQAYDGAGVVGGDADLVRISDNGAVTWNPEGIYRYTCLIEFVHKTSLVEYDCK